MKRLAILLVLVACVNPSVSRNAAASNGVAIPGAQLDDVRGAVVAQLASKGYSVLSASKYRVSGELPIRSDLWGTSTRTATMRSARTRMRS